MQILREIMPLRIIAKLKTLLPFKNKSNSKKKNKTKPSRSFDLLLNRNNANT